MVSKYYENDYLQDFLLLFMSLLTAKFFKTVIFGLEFTLSLYKMSKNKHETLLIPNFNLSEKLVKAVTN